MAVSNIIILKLFELVLTIICLGLHYRHEASLSDLEDAFVTATFAGYSLILIAVFARVLLRDSISTNVDIFYSLVGFALFATSGAIILTNVVTGASNVKYLGLTKGSISLINSVLFLLDACLTLLGN
ncbi:uncharacterized protein LOC134537624 [Bacillus rossius redtenbacheri]|uniref:uncharacterized protein LOC134537624 n=1 Tax=Bacillus rossius redtenbacheri TaxID=93214 RepID=UPI002FDCF42D